MKLNAEPAEPNGGARHFRRLKSNELVSHGDYVSNAQQGFELWEGPGGFRADAFVQPIYRLNGKRPGATRKPK